MPSDLERIAAAIRAYLDQRPQNSLEAIARDCRQMANYLGRMAPDFPVGQTVPLRLYAAAEACEAAVHMVVSATAIGNDWADSKVGGRGGRTVTDPSKRNPAPSINKPNDESPPPTDGAGPADPSTDDEDRPVRASDKEPSGSKDREKPVLVTTSGERGNWNSILDNLEPSTTYKVDDLYTFTTDERRRVILVEGELKLGKKDRSKSRQLKAGGQDRRSTDDGGHLIGNQFRGPSEAINYVAQLRTQNRPSVLDRANWYNLERQWAKALSSDPPQTVEVRIAIKYPKNSARPSAFIVNFSIGGRWRTQVFKN